MNFKKNVFSLLCMFSMTLGSVVYGQSIVEIADDANNYTQTENGYELKFNVLANSIEMDAIKSRVSNLSDRLSIEVLGYVNSKYEVVFTINHQNQASYVYKMMKYCGFKSLNYKSENVELVQIIQVLESYQ